MTRSKPGIGKLNWVAVTSLKRNSYVVITFLSYMSLQAGRCSVDKIFCKVSLHMSLTYAKDAKVKYFGALLGGKGVSA